MHVTEYDVFLSRPLENFSGICLVFLDVNTTVTLRLDLRPQSLSGLAPQFHFTTDSEHTAHKLKQTMIWDISNKKFIAVYYYNIRFLKNNQPCKFTDLGSGSTIINIRKSIQTKS